MVDNGLAIVVKVGNGKLDGGCALVDKETVQQTSLLYLTESVRRFHTNRDKAYLLLFFNSHGGPYCLLVDFYRYTSRNSRTRMGNGMSKESKSPSRSSNSPPESRSPVRESSSLRHTTQSTELPSQQRADALVAAIESRWAPLTKVFHSKICPPGDPESWPLVLLIALDRFSELVPVGEVGDLLGLALLERRSAGIAIPPHVTLVDVERALDIFRARIVASVARNWDCGEGGIEAIFPGQTQHQGSSDRWSIRLLERLHQLDEQVDDCDGFWGLLNTVLRDTGFELAETPLTVDHVESALELHHRRGIVASIEARWVARGFFIYSGQSIPQLNLV